MPLNSLDHAHLPLDTTVHTKKNIFVTNAFVIDTFPQFFDIPILSINGYHT